MSAAAEHRTASGRAGAELCREAARALAPCSRCDGGLTVSGSTAAALAELLRLVARQEEVPDVAVRAARRLLADLDSTGRAATADAPAPRAPAETPGAALASR